MHTEGTSIADTGGVVVTKPDDAPAVASALPPGQPDRRIRIGEVEHLTGLKRSTIYEKMKLGRFPRSRKLSSHCSVWLLSDVLAWVADPSL